MPPPDLSAGCNHCLPKIYLQDGIPIQRKLKVPFTNGIKRGRGGQQCTSFQQFEGAMTPQSDVTLAELDLPRDIIQMVRESVVPTKARKAWILDAVQDCEKSLSGASEAGSGTATLAEANRLQCKVLALQSLLAPIRRLPSEILIHVFHLYLLTASSDSHQTDVITQLTIVKPSPLVLARVCSSWRSTVNASPILWTRLNISGQGDCYAGPCVCSKQVDGFKAWMDRIAQQPWSLSIELVPPSVDVRERPSRVALSNILGHPAIARLRRLRVDAQAPITGVERQAFPSLDSLVIRWRHADYHMHFLESVFPDAPKLKKLVVVNVGNLNPVTDKLPWPNLTHLFIEGITLSKWRSVVGHCVSLQDGCFSITEQSQHVEEFVSSGNSPAEPLSLPHLTRLTFMNRPPLHHDLHEMAFPALEELNIFHGDWALGTWGTLTLHTFHNITRLTVVGRRRVQLEGAIFRLLEETPYVTDLSLDIQCDAGSLLGFLTHRRDKALLVCMEKLDVFCGINPSGDGIAGTPPPAQAPPFTDRLREMLLSRAPSSSSPTHRHPPPVLKGLKIRLPEAPWSAEAVRAIEDICRDVGLSDVEIVVVDQSRGASIPSMSILGDESDRYEHWDDGLLYFLNRL
ncbi:hypothetical protein FA13DRAFT_1815472 [Coprinellus micaceus]|uniref:F-box domain-containing protein n=1 Tax=Coprinellus micaceus TaxID=71717 RepID=A0A4Y7T489_COPMI|nr:hypothetical protein FA13DRAFT_1815472 [Coprinellus micaceus]